MSRIHIELRTVYELCGTVVHEARVKRPGSDWSEWSSYHYQFYLHLKEVAGA